MHTKVRIILRGFTVPFTIIIQTALNKNLETELEIMLLKLQLLCWGNNELADISADLPQVVF